MNKRTIGLCYTGTGDEYQSKIITSLMDYAGSCGIRLLIFACLDNKYGNKQHDDGEYSVFRLINYDKLDGLIILSETIKDAAVLNSIADRAKEHGVPLVCFDKALEQADCNIVFDDCGAVESLTEHLITVHGCRQINFIGGYTGQPVSDRRLASYKAALSKFGIPFEPERTAEGGWWAGGTKKAVDKWLEDGMVFDGIVCANDNMAMAAADELFDHGLRVPEDVKVTGIDALTSAECFIPKITTARFKHCEGIETAVDKLRDIWAGKPVDKLTVLGNDLVIADSCGCCSEGLVKSRINGRAFDLGFKLEILNTFDKHMIRFSNNVTSAASFEESLDIMAQYCKRAWTREMWIGVGRGFFESIGLSSEIPEQTELLIHKLDFVCERMNTFFSTDELLPELDKCLEDNKNILFMPLHLKSGVVGYIAREISNAAVLDQWYTFSMNLSSMFDVIRNQQHLRIANEQLENMYVHDQMTGVYNRRGFFREMSRRFAGRQGTEIMVVSADLDGLKEINDKYGHTEGDKAIEVIADALKFACGDKCVCARFGGDEFIAAGEYEAGLAQEFEEKFNLCIFNHNSANKAPYEIAASIGIVSDRCSFENIDKIISLADERMYMRKKERKLLSRQTPR
ncbi:MAG: GGDEF domain-containing protein [Ruminococcus sp.]|nr:GGDEF domain-containing protein [Ruminococcus sp.]